MFGAESILRKNLSSFTTLLVGTLVFFSIPSQIEVFDTGEGSVVNARTLPYIISSAIIVLSLLTIASNIYGASRSQPESSGEDTSLEDKKEATSYGRVFLAFLAIALWIVVLPYFGFSVATMFLVASIMVIIGNCHWWQILFLSLMLSFPVNYLLALVMGVYLPNGSLFG